MDRHRRIALIFLALLVSACSASPEGLSDVAGFDDGAGAAAWIASGQQGVYLIRWTSAEGVLAGSFAYTEVSGSSMTSDQVRATGVLAGGDVTLTLDAGTFLSEPATLTGEIDEDRLTVFFPTGDGRLQPLTFVRGTVDDYNSAVTALNGQAQERAAKERADAALSADADAKYDALNRALRDLDYAVQDWRASVEWLESGIDWVREGIESLEVELPEVRDAASYGSGYVDGYQAGLDGVGAELDQLVLVDLAQVDSAAEAISSAMSDVNRAIELIATVDPSYTDLDRESGLKTSADQALADANRVMAQEVPEARGRLETGIRALSERLQALYDAIESL